MSTVKQLSAGAFLGLAAVMAAVVVTSLTGCQSTGKVAAASCDAAAAPSGYAARSTFYDACLSSTSLSAWERAAALTARGTAKMMLASDKSAFGPAIADFDEAIRLRPSGGWARIGRGQLHQLRNELDEARADFNVALAGGTTAEKTEAYFFLGHLDAQQGEWSAAVRDFENARTLRPDLAGAYQSEALLLATCPDPRIVDGARSEILARESLRLLPDGFYGLEALAAAHARARRFDQAISEQQQVIAAADNSGVGANTAEGQRFRQALATYQKHEPLTYPPEMWAR